MDIPENLEQFETLVKILAGLRAPGGCPWDRKQTHRTLRENLLSESYEVLDALDSGDSARLCEELGDLLLQIVFHARIAAEAGEFKINDVVNSINTKLVHRHPHIFGTKKASTAEEVAHNWEELKREERKDTSILASVPRQMPSLAYAQEIQRRVVGVGFDWKDIDGVIDKLVEEVNELKEAAEGERKSQEFGDLLFTLVNVARRLGVDSEVALREANGRFYRRFAYMEELCRQCGLNFGELSFDRQNALWEEAKKKVG
ncbi:MAG: nucleoside triphosphate pyrophosphohydrolase [Dehalococcoidales bacterium]|nr:nucleoside triphosphate pyrophosphohydrolase [Dehalococcoidales bacterium]